MSRRLPGVLLVLSIVAMMAFAPAVTAMQLVTETPVPTEEVSPTEAPLPTDVPTEVPPPTEEILPTDVPLPTVEVVPATETPLPTVPSPTLTPTIAPTETPTPTIAPSPTATSPADCWIPFSDDFESGGLGLWTTSSGFTVQQAVVANGTWAGEGISTSGTASYARKTVSCPQPALYYRIAFKVDSSTNSSMSLIRFHSASGSIGSVYLSNTNRLAYRSDAGGFSVTSQTPVILGQWHTLQAQFDVPGQTVTVWYDGVQIPELSLAGQNLGTNPISLIQLGEHSSGRLFAFQADDVCVDIAPCSNIQVPAPAPTEAPTPTATIVPSPTPTATTPASCWVPFSDGFESGTLDAWTNVNGLAVQQATIANGAWAASATSTSGTPAYARKTLSCAQPGLYYQVAFKIDAIDSTSVSLVRFHTPTGSVGSVFVSSTNRLAYRSDAGGFTVTSQTTVSLNTWHVLQARFDVAGQSVEIWYDGAPVPDLSGGGRNLGTNPIAVIQLGEHGAGKQFNLTFDDICVDTVPCAGIAVPTPIPTMTPTPTTPAECWVPFTDGFESGNLDAWTSASGMSVQQANVANGQWAGQAISTSGTPAYARKTLPCAKGDLHYRINFMLDSKSPTTLYLIRFHTTNASVGGVFLSSTNRLGFRSDAGNFSITSPGTIVTTGTWHTLEARFDVTGQTVSIWYDGVAVADLTRTGQNLGSNPIEVVQLGDHVSGKQYSVTIDDICVDTVRCPTLTIPTPEPTVTPMPSPTPTPTAPHGTGETVSIMTVGDIACGEMSTGAKCQEMATSDIAVAGNPDAVLILGDVQYECGELDDFMEYYDPSWGRVKDITYPSIGNHEYSTTATNDNCSSAATGAPGYWEYYGDAATPLQPGCRVNCGGYYSFDIGDWHIIALNSNCSRAGGCSATSPQGRWLAADLAAHPEVCTLAFFHHPRFSSGKIGDAPTMDHFWQPLYAAGVDVILVGHDHHYERFAPMSPSGGMDQAFGMRQFLVGTGGRSLSSTLAPKANSEVIDARTFGVLEMTLRPTGYDWEFLPVAGQTFTDTGSGNCHGAPGSARTTDESVVTTGFQAHAALPAGNTRRSRMS